MKIGEHDNQGLKDALQKKPGNTYYVMPKFSSLRTCLIEFSSFRLRHIF